VDKKDNNWERRWHPLLREWVLIAANTQSRPINQGQALRDNKPLPQYDSHCYLCPKNERASGITNPDYNTTYAFENDFPSLSELAPDSNSENPLEKTSHLKGQCRVVCYHPHHNLALTDLNVEEIAEVFLTLKLQFEELGKLGNVENVLIFENKGKETGASNPHPHGQIYATPFIPKNIQNILTSYKLFKEENNECLMCKIIENEQKNEKEKRRVLFENKHFIAFVPFFARFAFETMIVPKKHHAAINTFNQEELLSLAEIYKSLMQSYDKLFDMPFANIISWVNSPISNNTVKKEFHSYLSFCPPLRSATQIKYLAGFESSGGNIVNPVQPEMAAELLKEASKKVSS
jgi:UDPglucose--hexose-1-phosphate uridylyltransferase